MAGVHAYCDDALGESDAVELAGRLRSRQVSAAELIEAAIRRAEQVNPALNGLAYAAFDRARRQAGGELGPGFFSGVPTFVKDNVDVAGMPTMSGTDAWTPRPAHANGHWAQLYFATGLIALGKTQLSEFGFSASAEHPRLRPVRNPWHLEHTAGASSAGSAAFVAAGVVPLAHANDGGGSIRIPASCTGLVGLKPTRGRLPLDTSMRQMPLRVVHNGVLTRTVRDTAAFYREAERIWHNRRLPPIGDVTGPSRARLTIAVMTGSLLRQAAPEVCALTLKTAALLDELGHRVEPLDRPPVPASFADDFVLYYALLSWALVHSGPRLFGTSFDRTKLDNLTLGFERHAGRNLHRIPLAVGRLATVRRRTSRLFDSYDVVLTPTLADPPPRVGHFDPTADYQQIIDRLIDWVAFTPLQNVTGDPAISLPLGQSSTGLPVGMMLTAARGRERQLLHLAYELEQAQPWQRIRHPPP